MKVAQPRRAQIGPFSAIEFPAGPESPCVILFHGYGADGADLAPLAAELPVKAAWRWLFPDAPGTMPFGGRAWFPINEAEIQKAQMTGKSVDWSRAAPPGLAEAAEAARAFIAESKAPWERLVLGGFSQGGILATELALSSEKAPLGLAVLSGNLVDGERWARLAAARKGLPFFQSHGIADPILGHQGARRLAEALQKGGLEGELLSFEGGHAIPPEVVGGLADFLDRLGRVKLL